MLRWLMRLIILGLIGMAVVFALRRVMGQEEDFDEYDDIEAGFEFNETPVEIDVPAESAGAAGDAGGTRGGGGQAQMSVSVGYDSPDGGGPGRDAGGDAGASSGGGTQELPSLIEINGIGPSYEARLQAAGINTVEDLAKADANALNEQLDVIGGASAIEDWISQAKELTSGGSKAQTNGRTQ